MAINTFIGIFIMCAALTDKGKAIQWLTKRIVNPRDYIQQQGGQ
jgi:hypothetical protein